MEFVMHRNFSKFSIEVTFFNTSTNLLVIVYKDKHFWRTKLYSNQDWYFGYGSYQEFFVE